MTKITEVAIYACGYCGSMEIVKNQEFCVYCKGKFNWSDTSTETVPSFPPVKEKYESGIPVNSGEFSFSEITTVSTQTGVEQIAGAPDGRCPCRKEIVDSEKDKRFRDNREKILKKCFPGAEIMRVVFLGVSKPFDMKRKPGFEHDHPGIVSSFVSRLYWIYADGKDKTVKLSWIWMKKEEEFSIYSNLLFKIVEADVVEHERDGKKYTNVGRFYRKSVDFLEADGVAKLLGAYVTTSDEILKFNKTKDPLDAFRMVTGTLLSKRETDFGYSLRIVIDNDMTDELPLQVLVGIKKDSLKLDLGGSLLVTGEMDKKHGYVKVDGEWKETEENFPLLRATGILNF